MFDETETPRKSEALAMEKTEKNLEPRRRKALEENQTVTKRIFSPNRSGFYFFKYSNFFACFASLR